MSEQFWGACQAMPGREHAVRADIEEMGRGAFLPTMGRVWVRDGLAFATEAPAVPGYVFFRTSADDWGSISNVDGVQRVLANQGIALRVSAADMYRMVIDHATGAHNRIEAWFNGERRERRRCKKPRPCKRIRVRNNTVR